MTTLSRCAQLCPESLPSVRTLARSTRSPCSKLQLPNLGVCAFRKKERKHDQEEPSPDCKIWEGREAVDLGSGLGRDRLLYNTSSRCVNSPHCS